MKSGSLVSSFRRRALYLPSAEFVSALNGHHGGNALQLKERNWYWWRDWVWNSGFVLSLAHERGCLVSIALDADVDVGVIKGEAPRRVRSL